MMNSMTIRKELADLAKMTPGQLRARYRELFGDEARSGNRQWLLRRCAWRVQAVAEGDLVERADRLRTRALEIANDADVRVIPPPQAVPDETKPRQVVATDLKPDQRLPIAQTVLTRPFKGRLHTVTVLPNGFEYDGDIYQSLTAVAYAITGSHWNGYHFFKKSLAYSQKLQEVG
jgi:hypothetical protein